MDIRTVWVGILVCCISDAFPNGSRPEQIHLSFGDDISSMVVMWSSHDDVNYNVTYGTEHDSLILYSGSDAIHQPKVAANAAPFVHRVVLQNLTQDEQYFYRIAPLYPDNRTLHHQSDVYSFTTLTHNQTKPLKFLVYGDMGIIGDIPTYDVLEHLVDSGNYTAVWHIGDFAYDLNDDLGKVGDNFFNRIQSFASRIPYMPTPGNHEKHDDFVHYRLRFSTPNTPWPIPLEQMWYSYNVGPVHFISYSTEVFFTYNEYYVCNQFDWLLQDLISANQNRDKQPWIIAMGHRPMYCSNSGGDDCTNRFLRRWVEYGLEDLFYAQGVDLILQAHEHSYERLWPVYKKEVLSYDYINPRAPVHIISGAAGSQEGINWMTEGKKNPWSAFKADKTALFTFGQLDIHNKTHIYFEQRESTANAVLDGFWLVQKQHGPFVANLTCEGDNRHHSCSCPPPILYVYIIIGASILALLIIAVLVMFCVCRYYKYKCQICRINSKHGDKDSKYERLVEECEHENLLKNDREETKSTPNLNHPNNQVPPLSANYDTNNVSRDTESINSYVINTDEMTDVPL